MEQMTFIVGALCSVLIFLLPPVKGLIVYVALIAWYPSYLSVKIGTLDFTVCRMVMLAIFANLFLFTDLPKKFGFILLDKIIILFFLTQVLAGLATTPALQLLENRTGAILDMLIPYFAVRLIITAKEQYLTLLKGMLFAAAPLALLGLYQTLTGNNIFSFIPGHIYAMGHYIRHGLYRANLTFSVSIMFGLYFAMIGPACLGLWRLIRKNRFLYALAIFLMGIGVFSSMSSGPWMAVILAGLFIVFYRFRRHWKTAVVLLVVACATVEVISNRHFYEVVDRITLNSKTAWYRSRLIEVALFEGGMSGHWLTGYGLKDPGWADKIDSRNHTDMVNHYLLILSRFGLVGLIPFLAVVTLALNTAFAAFRAGISDTDKWLIWTLAATLVGLLTALFSVSLFGPPKTVLYLLFGFCAAMPTIVRETNLRFFTALQINQQLLKTPAHDEAVSALQQ
jgi:hypothetical protein